MAAAHRQTVSGDPEERLELALAQRAYRELYETGFCHIFDNLIEALGRELVVPSHLVEHVVEKLENTFLLDERSPGFYDATRLALWYEATYERGEWRKRNKLRCEILEVAAKARVEGRQLKFAEDGERFIDGPFAEVAAAARVLEAYGLVEMDEMLGKSFYLSITTEGFDLVRDEAALRRELPRTATEDEEAHMAVAPDVLAEVIRSCEQLLEQRGWTSALGELRRGDAQHADGHWADAVSEYYAAVESGLKLRLDEAGVAYSEGAALRDLAKQAAAAGVIPLNYQQLFGFLDSVRSPRKHGRGRRVEEVDIGPGESLLMANHARTLLVYLGHRPQ